MLAVVLLVAGLFGTPNPVRSAAVNPAATCPAAPTATFSTVARACPALEVSGRLDATGAALDPAFDTTVAPQELARPIESGAVLSGYAQDGRKLFALPIGASGAFHLYIPLGVAAQQALTRIVLVAGQTTAERSATGANEPSAEIISLSDTSVIVAWNAHAYPAIRVSEGAEKAALASGNGTTTYEQLPVETRSRRLFIEFSDGVRSVTEGFKIFGR
jgi:hypothetical protein